MLLQNTISEKTGQQEQHAFQETKISKRSIVDGKDVLMPPLHITLGLVKNFVKQLGKSKFKKFAFLYNKFSKISDAKLKESIFVGQQI